MERRRSLFESKFVSQKQSTDTRIIPVTWIEGYKIGEEPAFGPRFSRRTLDLVGDSSDLLLKGRTAENQGMGIGAFGYYRRVVTDQMTRIIDRLVTAAEANAAKPEVIALLRDAKEERQFKRAMEQIELPDSLRIRGHNPLTLLHNATSEGLHGRSDAECLELATDVRMVLEELAERAARAIENEQEIASAVGRLSRLRGDE